MVYTRVSSQVETIFTDAQGFQFPFEDLWHFHEIEPNFQVLFLVLHIDALGVSTKMLLLDLHFIAHQR